MAEFGRKTKQKIEEKLLERETGKAIQRGKEIIREKKEGKEPTEEELREKTKNEILDYLKSLSEDLMGGIFFSSDASRKSGQSLDEFKSEIAKQDATKKIIESAIEQLSSGGYGKEIFEVISEFPTSQEVLAKRNIDYLKMIKDKNLKPEKPGEPEKIREKRDRQNKTTEKQIAGYKWQIELEQGKRRKWARQLKAWEMESLGKKNE